MCMVSYIHERSNWKVYLGQQQKATENLLEFLETDYLFPIQNS